MNNSNMSYNDNTGKQINNTRRANNVIAQQCNNLINNNNNNSNNNNNNNYSQNDRWHSACCKSKGSSKRGRPCDDRVPRIHSIEERNRAKFRRQRSKFIVIE